MRKTEAEKAAEATRRAISRMTTAPKRRRHPKNEFEVLGQAGPRGSMLFDEEYADVNAVIFDSLTKEWRKSKTGHPGSEWVKR